MNKAKLPKGHIVKMEYPGTTHIIVYLANKQSKIVKEMQSQGFRILGARKAGRYERRLVAETYETPSEFCVVSMERNK